MKDILLFLYCFVCLCLLGILFFLTLRSPIKTSLIKKHVKTIDYKQWIENFVVIICLMEWNKFRLTFYDEMILFLGLTSIFFILVFMIMAFTPKEKWRIMEEYDL